METIEQPVQRGRLSARSQQGFLIALALTFWVMPEALRPWSLLSWEDLRAWWKLAYPLIGQFLTTVSTWTAYFFFVEKVGSLELKAVSTSPELFHAGVYRHPGDATNHTNLRQRPAWSGATQRS